MLVLFVNLLAFSVSGGSDLAEGLVAHYTFSKEVKDVSGRNSESTFSGITSIEDRFGNPDNAFYFNADNLSGIIIQGDHVPRGNDSRTYSVWIKADWEAPTEGNFINRTFPIISFGGLEDGRQFTLQATTSEWLMVDLGGPNRNWLRTQTALTDNEWHHVCITFNNNKADLYLDGEPKEWTGFPLVGTQIDTKQTDLFIGATPWGHYFDGSIDDVRIYNKSLSASEVQNLFSLESGSPTPKFTQVKKALRLEMYLENGKQYQLEIFNSGDLEQWVEYGQPFTATSSKMVEYVDVESWDALWRIVEIQ